MRSFVRSEGLLSIRHVMEKAFGLDCASCHILTEI